LFVGATAAHAALTSEACLAKKLQARAKLEQCLATENGKTLQGKAADTGKCGVKFQAKIASLTAPVTPSRAASTTCAPFGAACDVLLSVFAGGRECFAEMSID
jgi:hypothetical protein